MTTTSLSSMYRIVKTLDPRIRIGREAKEELRRVVEEYATMISEMAITSARNSKRSTLLIQDITTAREQLLIGMKFHRSRSNNRRGK